MSLKLFSKICSTSTLRKVNFSAERDSRGVERGGGGAEKAVATKMPQTAAKGATSIPRECK